MAKTTLKGFATAPLFFDPQQQCRRWRQLLSTPLRRDTRYFAVYEGEVIEVHGGIVRLFGGAWRFEWERCFRSKADADAYIVQAAAR